MRELWFDHGNGMLSIDTDTLHIHINSKARKNYRHVHSHWNLAFHVKGKYGYMARIWCDFADTMEGAMNRAETMMKEMFESIQEII